MKADMQYMFYYIPKIIYEVFCKGGAKTCFFQELTSKITRSHNIAPCNNTLERAITDVILHGRE